MTLSSRLIMAPAGVMGASFHPSARLCILLWIMADAKCIWMLLTRTGTLFIFLFGFVISICDNQPNTAYLCASFYYARKQTTYRNSPRILIGTPAKCARKWRWKTAALSSSAISNATNWRKISWFYWFLRSHEAKARTCPRWTQADHIMLLSG